MATTESSEYRLGRIEGQLDQVVSRLDRIEARLDKLIFALFGAGLTLGVAVAVLLVRSFTGR